MAGRRTIAALVSAASVMAGCGGDQPPRRDAAASPTPAATAADATKDGYEKAWAELVRKWRREAKEIIGPSVGDSPRHRFAMLSGLAGLMRTMTVDLRALEPPQEVRRSHEHYIQGLEALIERAEGGADAFVRGDKRAPARAMDPASLARSRGSRLLRAALRDFERAGYDLPGPPVLGDGRQ